MTGKRFLLVPLMALIIIGLVAAGGLAIHRVGWVQGYALGQLTAGGESGAMMPRAPLGFAPFMCGTGLFFAAGLILLFAVIGGLFRIAAWRMMSGPPGEDRARRWHGPHGPVPPWCWGWEKPSGEKTEKAEPDGEASDARAKI